MKSPKERQRAYRERRKEHKNAGLAKLKILTSAAAAKRLEILSEIDGVDPGTVFGQAIDLFWTQRLGSSEVAPESAPKPETTKPAKAEKVKPEKEKAVKAEKVKPEKKKSAKSEKSKKKPMKSKREVENSEVVAVS